MCLHAESLQSRTTLCDPMDCSLLGSSVHGILQVRILEWIVMPSPKGSSWPRDRTCISYISHICRLVRAFLVAQLVKNLSAIWEAWVRSLSWEDPLDKGTAAHSSILENSMNHVVHGVTKSQMRLSYFHFFTTSSTWKAHNKGMAQIIPCLPNTWAPCHRNWAV